ncbi:11742_t:CDS:2, partial [Racocetra persica]
MSYLARKDEVSQHWTESGSMDLLEKALLNDEIQEQIQQLVKDKTIVSPIETQISFGAFKQPETLFSLLLFSGYLSPVTRSAQTDAYDEQESGQGRADLILIPKSKPLHHAFIIEYKACDREEELDLTAQKGLKQIKNKKYNVK